MAAKLQMIHLMSYIDINMIIVSGLFFIFYETPSNNFIYGIVYSNISCTVIVAAPCWMSLAHYCITVAIH